MIIRPKYTVLGGAAIGLIAASAVYGAVSTTTSATSTRSVSLTKPAAASVAAPATAARCAAGEKLEHGVCVVHVQRVVARPAPSAVPAEDPATGWVQGTGPAPEEAAHKAAGHANDAAEHETENDS